jgi:hypothetical protein
MFYNILYVRYLREYRRRLKFPEILAFCVIFLALITQELHKLKIQEYAGWLYVIEKIGAQRDLK